MPLNVSYKNRIGYYTLTEKYDGKETKYRIWICHSNSLWAEMYFYKDEKGVDMARLHSFFVDPAHLKNCLKDGMLDGCSNYHFKQKEMNPEIWKAVKLLTEHSIKVTIN